MSAPVSPAGKPDRARPRDTMVPSLVREERAGQARRLAALGLKWAAA